MRLFLALLCLLPLPAAWAGTVVFSESFEDNSAGWTLGPEWQIGPARGDNGIAGVKIDSSAGHGTHSQAYWLASPEIPIPKSNRVLLHFERRLNSDQAPYMTNRIEAWNGKAWVLLWESPTGERIEDADWTHQTIDVTAHQNPAFRVRFGFTRLPGAFHASSWNLDDVQVEAWPRPNTQATGGLALLYLLGFAALGAVTILIPIHGTRG